MLRLKHVSINPALIDSIHGCLRSQDQRGQVSRYLTQPPTLKSLEQALRRSVPEVHHSDQGAQYLSNVYLLTLAAHGFEISVARRGYPSLNIKKQLHRNSENF